MTEKINSISESGIEVDSNFDVVAEVTAIESRCPAMRFLGERIIYGSQISCPNDRKIYLKPYTEKMHRLEEMKNSEQCDLAGDPPGNELEEFPTPHHGGCELAEQCPVYLNNKEYIINGRKELSA